MVYDIYWVGDGTQRKRSRRKRAQEGEGIVDDIDAYAQHLADIEAFDQLIREMEDAPLVPCEEYAKKFSAARFNGYSRYN